MKVFVNSKGFIKVLIEPEKKLVSSFLEHDVQSSLFGVDEYLKACKDVTAGEIVDWEGTGNSHTVNISKDCVTIFNEYTEEELTINSINEFITYLECWRRFLLDNGVKQ